jgi:hypothetical protein
MPKGSDVQERDILTRVREAAAKRILFLLHAVNQMNAPERMISTEEVRAVVFHGVLVENYPEDVRGHSCLMLGWGEGDRPLHVVCAPKADYLAVITTYLPSSTQWEPDWQTRRKR